MNIRPLTPSDAPSFHALRLVALLDKPEAFASSHDEEQDLSMDEVRARLAGSPRQVVFGAFDGDQLVGIVGVARDARAKLSHKCDIQSMYVAGSARGQGVARELVLAALAHARGSAGVAKVILCVDSANVPAIALYESLGFVVFAREHDAMRIDGEQRDDLQMQLRFETASAD